MKIWRMSKINVMREKCSAKQAIMYAFTCVFFLVVQELERLQRIKGA